MSVDYLSMSGEGDHTITLMLAGDAESLRPRLIVALERVGYHVTSEQPLMARKGAKSWAKFGCSWDAMEYPTKLTVALREQNKTTTLATFDYEVKNPFLTSGDQQTLAREAKVIAALATQHVAARCSVCGMETTDDSRFCRRCGAPLVGEVAELEVLRMTSGARSGFQQIVAGTLFIVFSVALATLIFFVKTKPNAALLVLLMFGLPSLMMFISGIWRLHLTLNAEQRNGDAAPSQRGATGQLLPAAAFANASASPLPLRYEIGSLTEGTTELLQPVKEREPVPVKAQRDTSEVR